MALLVMALLDICPVFSNIRDNVRLGQETAKQLDQAITPYNIQTFRINTAVLGLAIKLSSLAAP